jgi:hypothetical protein
MGGRTARFVPVAEPAPEPADSTDLNQDAGFIARWVIPAVAGTAAGVGLAALGVYGVMPVGAVYTIVGLVAVWAAVVTVIHIRSHRATSSNEE